MTAVWRPADGIRVKALGLHWRGDRLLAFEVYCDDGRVKGVRPLGGTVEFGESTEAALAREFQEELGLTIVVLAPPIVMENIYAHEGTAGHEILFLFEIGLPVGALDGQDRVVFREEDGVESVAGWYRLDELDLDGGPELYPTGLKQRLATRSHRKAPRPGRLMRRAPTGTPRRPAPDSR